MVYGKGKRNRQKGDEEITKEEGRNVGISRGGRGGDG